MFQSRNRDTSRFNWCPAGACGFRGWLVSISQSRYFSFQLGCSSWFHGFKTTCFNLAIEILLVSTLLPRSIYLKVVISFQSRNRDTSRFNAITPTQFDKEGEIKTFQSRNRDTSRFNGTARAQSRMAPRCFNLAIEILLVSTIIRDSHLQMIPIFFVSISQSRYFSFQRSGAGARSLPMDDRVSISQSRYFSFQPFGFSNIFIASNKLFQSRNRDTSRFNQRGTYPNQRLTLPFQSRNRDTSRFNSQRNVQCRKCWCVSISQSRYFSFQPRGNPMKYYTPLLSFNLAIEILLVSTQTHWKSGRIVEYCFNLAIEILLVSTRIRRIPREIRTGVSISQSRYFSFQLCMWICYRERPNVFQSRNRDTSRFNESPRVPPIARVRLRFQSRNRDTSRFNSRNFTEIANLSIFSFNLAIEILLVSTGWQGWLPRCPLVCFNLAIEILLVSTIRLQGCCDRCLRSKFQSRNRDTSRFNFSTDEPIPIVVVYIKFQSRNRDTSRFNQSSLSWFWNSISSGFNLAIEILLVSTNASRSVWYWEFPLFQSRNRDTSRFNAKKAERRDTGNSLSFNLAIEILLVSTKMRPQQHRAPKPRPFQSRNRDTSRFNKNADDSPLPTLPRFQSRNRDTSRFNKRIRWGGRLRRQLRFNLAIEILLVSTGNGFYLLCGDTFVSISQSRYFSFQHRREVTGVHRAVLFVSISQSRYFSFQHRIQEGVDKFKDKVSISQSRYFSFQPV